MPRCRCERERARPDFRTALGFMRIEAVAGSREVFPAGDRHRSRVRGCLLRARPRQMRMKKYAEAIAAYVKCRDLYQRAGRKAVHEQPGRAALQAGPPDRDRRVRSARTQTGPQTLTSQDRVRQLQEQRRQIQDCISRGAATSASTTRSPRSSRWRSGSAYFRTEQFAGCRTRVQGGDCGGPEEGRSLQQPRGGVPADRALQGGRRCGEVG